MKDVDAFRRDRGLLSGDDVGAWLEQAGLDEEEWVRRVLAGDAAELPGPLPSAGRSAQAERPAPLSSDTPPHVWVDAPQGCGDAALRVVCRAHGLRSAPRLGEDASLAQIVEAGRAAGLPAMALKVSRRRMGELPPPWIAHVDGGHWLVVHAVGADELVVSDPARGAGTLRRSAFAARWSGWCAVFAPVVQSD